MMALPTVTFEYRVIQRNEQEQKNGTVKRTVLLSGSGESDQQQYFNVPVHSAEAFARFPLNGLVQVGLTPLGAAVNGAGMTATEVQSTGTEPLVCNVRVDVDTSAADAKLTEFGNRLEKLQALAKGYQP